MMALLPELIASSAIPPADPAQARNALVLFLIVVTVLGVFLVGLALAIASHRARHRKPPPKVEKPLPDPWREAAERIQPMPDNEIRE